MSSWVIVICVIFCVIGAFVTAMLILYFLLGPVHRWLVEVSPMVDSRAMPQLRPIPIPTQNYRSGTRRLLVWFVDNRRWELSDDWTYELKDGIQIVLPKNLNSMVPPFPDPCGGSSTPRDYC